MERTTSAPRIARSILPLLMSLFVVGDCLAELPDFDTPQNKERVEKIQRWYHKVLVEEYKSVGKKNAKWDADALEALEAFSKSMCPTDKCKGNEAWIAYDAGKLAMDKGCDDPCLTFATGFSGWVTRDLDAKQAAELGIKSADAMIGGKYSPLRQITSCRWAVDVLYENESFPNRRALAKKYCEHCLKMLPEVMKDPDAPDFKKVQAAQLVWGSYTTYLEDPLRTLDACCAALGDTHPYAVLAVKGHCYRNTLGRDESDPKEPSDDSKSPFMTRSRQLQAAQDALTQAWEKDPKLADAATQMVSLAILKPLDSDQMETWFQRAMDADPNNDEACHFKIVWLADRQDRAKACEFGRECLKKGNYISRIPLAYERVLWSWGKNNPDLFKQPEIWDDLQQFYTGQLKVFPLMYDVRSRYAYVAAITGHWAVADEQFKILKDKVVSKPFGQTPARMEELGKTATQKVAQGIKEESLETPDKPED